MALEDSKSVGFWLQVEGYPNGPSWVSKEYIMDDIVLLGKGWKSFACFRRLTQGQCLVFQFDGKQTISMKIYRAAGGRVECYAESESRSNSSDFFDKDKDEESSPDIKVEASSSS